jgi:hypothetical protein
VWLVLVVRRRAEPARHREVVEAFLAASRSGSFEALVSVLDPEIVLRVDDGTSAGARIVQGAERVATGALLFSQYARHIQVVSVNGMPGLASIADGKVWSVAGFTVADGKVVELTIPANPERLAQLDLSELL